ncbi:hypothetical protein HYH02_011471 [Chlamydomonas schloesseri]|uniref:Uncharacterized protein n=1 Tax=Chlamydomonas schloesseri TaxID=2026947 RepID=A0A835T5K8_9CHLO|nr:hypothetical protein HYH02_011471 [Chlamydomonas schloesseri]|eukprot:KAG2436533.1 hypothetical protein HYH02_011471 [Chlamydomonas schloesseri]
MLRDQELDAETVEQINTDIVPGLQLVQRTHYQALASKKAADVKAMLAAAVKGKAAELAAATTSEAAKRSHEELAESVEERRRVRAKTAAKPAIDFGSQSLMALPDPFGADGDGGDLPPLPPGAEGVEEEDGDVRLPLPPPQAQQQEQQQQQQVPLALPPAPQQPAQQGSVAAMAAAAGLAVAEQGRVKLAVSRIDAGLMGLGVGAGVQPMARVGSQPLPGSEAPGAVPMNMSQ